jgi:hypothetical protein
VLFVLIVFLVLFLSVFAGIRAKQFLVVNCYIIYFNDNYVDNDSINNDKNDVINSVLIDKLSVLSDK